MGFLSRAFYFSVGLATVVWVASLYSRVPREQLTQIRKEGHVIAGAFVVFAVFLMTRAVVPAKQSRRYRGVGKSILDTVLLMWTPSDPFRIRDLVAGGVCIIGRTGSGKTSSSGFQLARAIVGIPVTAGCIIASKPEDKQFWQKIFNAAGRNADLLVFEPRSGLQFNVIDFEMQNGGDSHEVTRFILTIDDAMQRSGNGGGTNEKFWEKSKARTIYNGVEIIRKAIGKVSAPSLAALITDAATSEAQLTEEKWRQGNHCQMLAEAMKAPKTEAEEHDYRQAVDFWLGEWPRMDVKVRSSIMADIMGVLHTLNTGEIRTLLSGGTNVSPAIMERSKWVLVNMPVHEKGAGGLAVSTAWKYATQRHILRRHANRTTNPIIIWCDEYQNVCNSVQDAAFLAETRSHLGGMVVLTHGLHSFQTSAKGEEGNRHAMSLMSNFPVKVVHSLAEHDTAKFASNLVGRALQQRGGFSRSPRANLWDDMMGEGGMSFNSSERMEEILEPNEFFRLRTGGEINNFEADAIVIKSGEPFAWGGNWLKVAFSQR
ncbi:MAG TPA: hypothetical protein VE988_10695 [Gemmataceae bacterium]|nr:hypothetical protein [Gemmataceae bacterium]